MLATAHALVSWLEKACRTMLDAVTDQEDQMLPTRHRAEALLERMRRLQRAQV